MMRQEPREIGLAAICTSPASRGRGRTTEGSHRVLQRWRLAVNAMFLDRSSLVLPDGNRIVELDGRWSKVRVLTQQLHHVPQNALHLRISCYEDEKSYRDYIISTM